jgi:hypothetical protein
MYALVEKTLLSESSPHLCRGISLGTCEMVLAIKNIDSSQVSDEEDIQETCTR